MVRSRWSATVGPRSAGAEPGPACYSKGGTAATVTDAKLITGVINPHNFLGGEIALDIDLARQAYQPIAERLGVSIEEAANGIIRLADHHMINALKLISVRRGYDPRDFVLIASGGGGPMHAAALARELLFKQVVIPPYPGHFSAWSMLMIKPRVDLLRTSVHNTRAVDAATIQAVYAELQAEALARFADAPVEQLIWQRSADMRYYGQEHTVKVPLPAGASCDIAEIERTFHAAHRRAYTFELPDAAIEFVTFHLTAWRNTRQPALRSLHGADQHGTPTVRGQRAVNFDVLGTHMVPIYERDRLPAGFQAAGPLIIEEMASTTLVYPDQYLTVDSFANMIIRSQEASS
ncbi:MAG: hydantoinase/oxoprolinase family protein [Chloroflexaceae bacterium]|nr:hydantoinase/oxoprolinase family protein [Chloroflexaceae bacterium]